MVVIVRRYNIIGSLISRTESFSLYHSYAALKVFPFDVMRGVSRGRFKLDRYAHQSKIIRNRAYSARCVASSLLQDYHLLIITFKSDPEIPLI
jgi:hypothetical protein